MLTKQHEELSIEILLYCKTFKICNLHKQIDSNLLTRKAAIAFNGLFKNQSNITKIYSAEIADLINLVNSQEEWIPESFEPFEADEQFYGQVFNVDGKMVVADSGIVISSSTAKQSHDNYNKLCIKQAMFDFGKLIKKLKAISNSELGAA